MKAGELRHPMTIEAPIGVLSESEAVTVDTDVMMKVEVLPPAFQPREGLSLGGLNTQTFYTVTCRYRTDLRASLVLREACCTQRVFQVLTIVPGDRRESIAMTCVTNG